MRHHRRLATLFVLFACLLPASAAPGAEPLRLPGIKGTDDRELVRSTDWPWRAIGRVNVESGGFCTGVLVAPRTVLTAAHCLWRPRVRTWARPSSVHFLAGYQRGSFQGHARAAAYRLGGPSGTETPREARAPADDWALITLASDPGSAPGAIPVLASPSNNGADGRLLNAGYAQDKAHILTRHEPCALLGSAAGGRLLLHDCDATSGSSGSPILLRRGDDYRIVAIHTSTSRADGVTYGVAIPAARFMGALREAGIDEAP